MLLLATHAENVSAIIQRIGITRNTMDDTGKKLIKYTFLWFRVICWSKHYSDVIMSTMASQITGISIVC